MNKLYFISEALWYSSESKLTAIAEYTIMCAEFEDRYSTTFVASPGTNELI